jgi:hypothetical protein
MNALRFKRLLVTFWFLWLVVVWASNLCDGLKEIGILHESWLFASGNFRFMSQATGRYGTPGWVNAVLFVGVLLWEAAAAVLFGLASWKPLPSPFLYPAFAASLMLLAAFILADEVLISYRVEETHLRLFIAQLLTLLAVALLPREPPVG